jgi:REP element-mobilizing transposase RayT
MSFDKGIFKNKVFKIKQNRMNIRNEILVPEAYYHIYNRGINSGKIFSSDENYLFFLSKFATYLNPVCDVFAYCLMPNHFHFLIRVKKEEEIRNFAKESNTFVKVQNSNDTFVKVQNFDKGYQDKGLHTFDSLVSKQIGKFISSYSQAYNKVTNRHGALLESPFKRKRIDSEEYLRNLIVYIHLNPTDLKQDFETYNFSSYKSILSNSKTNLKREEVITVFDDLENYIYSHRHPSKFDFTF